MRLGPGEAPLALDESPKSTQAVLWENRPLGMVNSGKFPHQTSVPSQRCLTARLSSCRSWGIFTLGNPLAPAGSYLSALSDF